MRQHGATSTQHYTTTIAHMDDRLNQLLTIAEAARLTGVAKPPSPRAKGRGEFPRAQQKQGTWYIPIGDLITSGRLDTITHNPRNPHQCNQRTRPPKSSARTRTRKTTRTLRRTTTAPGSATHPSQTRHHRSTQNNYPRTRNHPTKTTHRPRSNPPTPKPSPRTHQQQAQPPTTPQPMARKMKILSSIPST